jgi:type I restriction enzyme M protein
MFFDRPGPTKEIWYYELVPAEDKKYSKANPITDNDLKDCFEKWERKEISENSWIVPVKEIVKKDYDLTARNPAKKEEIETKTPEELISGILDKEKEIKKIAEEIQDLLKTSGETQ